VKKRQLGKEKNEGEGNSDFQPPRLRPLWKIKKWLEIANDFKWAIMVLVKLERLWKLHWEPIRIDLEFFFLLGN